MNGPNTEPLGPYILGIDVGGTHTDIELIDVASGQIFRHKILSTPSSPSLAIRQGTAEIIEQAGIAGQSIRYFANGTTVATNALVQKRTATTGLITTKGFRDVLEIRRQRQPHIYNISIPKPAPPALRRHRREVDERKYLFGRADVAPKKEDVLRVAQELIDDGVEAIAVCFLNSYFDASHERLVQQWLIEKFPDVYTSASCDVLPEFREYERVSTTVLNASLGPVMQQYLESITRDARTNGLLIEPKILQSNGGVASPAEASTFPVRTLASGPAAGVMGALKVAADVREANIITFDVGGTTADICLVENGRPLFASERDFSGYPIRFPMVDVLSIGAGGGSIAWLDPGGFLHVGPQSAGAVPGPVCYGRGGTEPTVTDANLVLGRLNPSGLLGGRVRVDKDGAWRAIKKTIGDPMGVSVEAAAVGILTILNENMVQAVRVTSVERGHDPREFALLAFGGGGPLLAGKLAAELEMNRVIIPKSPGLLCAEGLLVADTRSDFSKTHIVGLTTDTAPLIHDTLQELTALAISWFEKEGIAEERRSIAYIVDMRYKGQSHELRVPLNSIDESGAALSKLRAEFKSAHQRMYGFAPDDEVELVTFRLVATASTYSYPRESPQSDLDQPGVRLPKRDVYFEELCGYVSCDVYDRMRLKPGTEITGPVILEQMDTTTVVRPFQWIRVQPFGEIILHIGKTEGTQ